jgi:hypothetical protein
LGLSWKLEDTRLNITAIQPSKSLMEWWLTHTYNRNKYNK